MPSSGVELLLLGTAGLLVPSSGLTGPRYLCTNISVPPT